MVNIKKLFSSEGLIYSGTTLSLSMSKTEFSVINCIDLIYFISQTSASFTVELRNNLKEPVTQYKVV